jgi:hypothetical protein
VPLYEPLPDLLRDFGFAAWRSDLRTVPHPLIGKPILILRCNRQCLLEWRTLSVVEPCREKITPENSLVANALPRLVGTALADGRVDFLTNASANTPGLALPKPAAVGAA